MPSFESGTKEDLSLQKTKYFAHFAAEHFSAFKILQKGGVIGRGNEAWRNIAEHCITEAVMADILAENLGADRAKLVTAALLHDWYKRHEVEAMNELGAAEGYRTSAGKDEELLKEYGVPEDIIHLAHSNIPESNLPEYIDNRPIEERIMHFVDMTTSGSDILPYEERMVPVLQKPRNVDFIESFRDRYNGRNLYEVQGEITAKEQEEFEKRLGLEPGTIFDFMKNKLAERIAAF